METHVWADPYQSRFGSTEIQTLPETNKVSIEQAIAAEAEVLAVPVNQFGVTSTVGEVLASKELISDDKETPPFYTSYFLDLSGQKLEVGEKTFAIPQFDDEQAVVGWLSSLAIEPDNNSELLKLALLSQTEFIDKASDWYANGSDQSTKPNDKLTLININPAASVDQLVRLQATKKAIRDFAVDKKGDMDEATKAWVAIYLSKTNNELADRLPRMRSIAVQAAHNPEEYEALTMTLDAVLPKGFLSAIVTIEDEDRMQQLYRRLDYIRNGFAHNSSSNSTVVDERIEQLEQDTQQEVEPVFSTPEYEMLKSIEVTPEQASAMVAKLFEHYGLADKGWSFETNPTKRTYAVDQIKKVFKVTHDTYNLSSTISVGLVHEFWHVFQAINDEALPYKVGAIKGKRAVGLREAGAIANEQQANHALFGVAPSGPNMTYARALQALEQGGSPLDAVGAFAGEKDKNGQTSKESGKVAADRVIRLVRKGFNSQPMVYAEGQLFKQTVHEIGNMHPGVGANVTSLDIPDQLRLQQIGALPQAQESFELQEHFMAVLSVVAEVIPEVKDTAEAAIKSLESTKGK